MIEGDKEKLAAFYTSPNFEALRKLIAHKIRVSQNDRRSLESFEKTALNVARQEGGEEFGLTLLKDIEMIYKKMAKK